MPTGIYTRKPRTKKIVPVKPPYVPLGPTPTSPESRVWSRIQKTESCWLWTGSIDGRGYGVVASGPRGKQKHHRVHLLTYRMANGSYDPSLELHHLCRVKHCCNPDHLRPIDKATHRRIHNCGFKTTRCPKGHGYTPDNTYLSPQGKRTCRACNLYYTHKRRGKTPTGHQE